MRQVLKRAFIRIAGPERTNFLQGLITQDIFKVTPETPQYSLMLTPQGRFLFDFFLTMHTDSYLLEVDERVQEPLAKRLFLYKLRSAVEISMPQELQVVVSLKPQADLAANIVAFPDPRLEALGWRYYLPAHMSFKDSWDFRRHAMALGVADGFLDLIPNKSIPLECNMDEMKGISFDKGCYLGQELTARTKHAGVLRKRLLPGFISDSWAAASLIPGMSLWADSVKLGTIQVVYQDLFLARIQWEPFLKVKKEGKLITTKEGLTVGLSISSFLKDSCLPS